LLLRIFALRQSRLPRTLPASVIRIFLVPFKNGQTTGVCDQICSAAELQSLLSYYKGLCGAQAAPAAPATKTTSGAAQVTVTVPATSSTGAASGSSSGKTRNNHKSWISEHYGWIIMIIVLVLAAIAGIIFGVWFKRRSARHPNTNRDAVLGTRDASHVLRDPHAIPGSSPPSTAQHTGGMNPREFYASTGSLRSGTSVPRSQTMRSMGSIGTGMMSPSASLVDSKGKAKADRNQITEVPGPMPPRRTSTKLQRKGSSGGILPPRSPI